jgi:hypothetical protein
MFHSPEPFSDLIFQDAAQQLQIIPENQRNYISYLGRAFLRARALVDCRAGVGRNFKNSNLILSAPISILVSIFVINFQNLN